MKPSVDRSCSGKCKLAFFSIQFLLNANRLPLPNQKLQTIVELEGDLASNVEQVSGWVGGVYCLGGLKAVCD